jgi:hypothetical protein
MDTLSKLQAIEDIKMLKARYFRGVDTKDRELLRSVFADAATADYRGAVTDPQSGINAVPGTTEEVVRGGDAIADGVIAAVAALVTVHHGSIPEIEITGEDTAIGIWPMVDILRMPPTASVKGLVGYGHYHETYVRQKGLWKIQSLRLTRLRVDVTTT